MAPKTAKKSLVPLFADVLADEVNVLPDWRYQLVVPYIRLSSSYLAVRDKDRGIKVAKSDLPKDEKLVHHVAHWFDLLAVAADEDDGNQTDWWERAGKTLYGYEIPIPTVSHFFIGAQQSKQLQAGEVDYPSIALNVPLTLTMTEAIAQIKSVFKMYERNFGVDFGLNLPDSYTAHYKLEPCRLRRDTLVKGIDALTMHREGFPLWQIGNRLELSVSNAIDETDIDMDQDELARRKRALSIMTRRLVKTASLVAENAARGRFPSDKPFAEAMLGAYERTGGRPKGSGRALRNHVYDNYFAQNTLIKK